MSSHITYDAETTSYTLSAEITTDELQTLVNEAEAGATLNFLAGTYDFSKTLTISRSDIHLKGAGAEETIFIIDPEGGGRDGLQVMGSRATNYEGTITADTSRGDRVLHLAEDHTLQAGDVVRIHQANADGLTQTGLYDNVLEDHSYSTSPLRESLVRIESIDGNIATLEHDIAYDFDSEFAQIERHIMAKDVSISDLTLTYDLGTPDPDNIDNTFLDYRKFTALRAEWTENFTLENVNVTDVASHGVQIKSTLEPFVSNFTAIGAHNKGDGKNGYGIFIEETFYGEFEHLTLIDHRHSFLFGGWHAQAYNDVQIDFANRDINYHGGPDHSNVVTIDEFIYRNGDNNEVWSVIGPPASIHPATDLSENTNLFINAQGGSDPDIIMGVDTGATLSGGDGDDILIGGAGDDNLNGDHGFDILSGGEGADRFIIKAGEGTTIITDFSAEDSLLLQNFSYYSEFSELPMVQDGADILIELLGSAIIRLLNVNLTDITAEQVQFEALEDSGIVLTGSNEDDILDGTLFDDHLVSGDGADTLTSHTGDDIIESGKGNDRIDSGLGNDTILSGDGDDRIYANFGDDYIEGGDGADILLAGRGSDTVYGGDGNDEIRGDRAQDFLYGEAGDDYIEGDDGDDRIWGGDGDDYLRGESGFDGLWGGNGNDWLKGYSGNDSLYGEAGDDTLDGGDGRDKIGGGLGEDHIYAGAGNDRVIVEESLDKVDIWHDYNRSLNEGDEIDLQIFNFTQAAETLLEEGYLNLVEIEATQSPYGTAGVMLQIDRDGTLGETYELQDALFLAHTEAAQVDLGFILT